jgi:hypothetical protein
MARNAPIELPHWPTFRTAARNMGLVLFRMTDDWPLLYRFHARYRLAGSCSGLRFDVPEYDDRVAQGYDGLTRCFLAWSAFEMYAKLIGAQSIAQASLLNQCGAEALLDRLRTDAENLKFLGVVAQTLNHEGHRREFQSFLDGRTCDSGRVLSSVRHVFAHGYLTPSAGGGDQLAAATACVAIADFLLSSVILGDWDRRVCKVLGEIFSNA